MIHQDKLAVDITKTGALGPVQTVVMIGRIVGPCIVLVKLRELPKQSLSFQRRARHIAHYISAFFPLVAITFQLCVEGFAATSEKIAALPPQGLTLVVLLPMFFSVSTRMSATLTVRSRLPHLFAMCVTYLKGREATHESILAVFSVCWIWSMALLMVFYQEKLERQLYFAQEIDTERNMAAFLCHEIRNPLNGLTGSLDQIHQSVLRGSAEPVKISDWCRCGLVSAKHLSDILDNVLDQSKLEQGKLVLDSKPVDLSRLCASVADMLQQTKQERVEFVTTVPGGLTILGDAVRWRQLLINLVSNALKFTKSGRVSLTIKCIDKEGVDGGSRDLLVEVCDTGLGIPAALMPTLFRRYAQGGFHAGSGLGLNIANQIVELMGSGTIQVMSPWQEDCSVGTRFSFTVCGPVFCDITPAETCSTLQKESGTAVLPKLELRPSQPAVDALTVLLVEDDTLNVMIMTAKLNQLSTVCGHITIKVAHSGEDALALYDEELEGLVSLIIMDEHLQQGGGTLKGTETTKQLRGKGCKAVIVACSGNCLAADTAPYLEAGSTAAWPKPYPDNAKITDDLLRWFGEGLEPWGVTQSAGAKKEN
jgi:signal transduction histidine kinase